MSRPLPDGLPVAADVPNLVGTARRIRAELRLHPGYQPLRGKNLALLMACPPGPESALLQAAAAQLGARVALVRYSHNAGAQARDIEALAGALGRLYDAIDCEALPAPVPQQIARCSGVPVTEGLGGTQHPVCAVAELMAREGVPGLVGVALDEGWRADNHLRLVQAVLLESMAGPRWI